MNMWLQIIVSDVSQLLPVKCGAESQSKEKKEAKDCRVVNTRWNLDHGVTDKGQSVIGRQHTQKGCSSKRCEYGENTANVVSYFQFTFNIFSSWLDYNQRIRQTGE